MAFTKPIFCAGVDIPNCNFQLPGDSGGLAAGWVSRGGTFSAYGLYGASFVGRPRMQAIYIPYSNSIGIESAPSVPYHMTHQSTTTVFYVLSSSSTPASGTTVTVGIEYYDSTGTAIGAVRVLDMILVVTTMGLYSGVGSVVPPSGSVFMKLVIGINPVMPMTAFLSFAGVGCWNGSTSGYFQPTRFPVVPGTRGGMASPASNLYRSESGIVRTVDRGRRARQNNVALAFASMPDSDKIQLEKLYGLNSGQNWEASGLVEEQNPGGGSWPILLLPGMTGLPDAMLCDMTSGFSLEPDSEWGRTDPPYWQGALEFTERG